MNRPNSETVEVRLGERSYKVLIGDGILHSLGELLHGLGLGISCAVIRRPLPLGAGRPESCSMTT